ncbi:MAG: FAD-dependent oxidoreductase [bacterium]|nr:FAD-dependent oxidoreductase [bacterium]
MPANAAKDLPARAGAVIVGGGIVGCSIAYHLTRRGLRNVVLLERRKLTCGTTWHAAGLVAQLRATHNMTRLARYSAELYEHLAEETGQATGFTRTGSLSVATGPERLEELLRQASMARCFDVEVEVCTPEQVAERWPHARTDDLAGAVFVPGDASTGPVDTTIALAAGARAGGAQIFENTRVTKLLHEGGRVRGVHSERGSIESPVVVNAAGMWARELGASCGVNVPLHAAEHFYVITEPIPGLPEALPTLRDPDGCAYFKREAGGALLVGFFEPVAKPWGMNGIPDSFAFDCLPDDWEHLEPELEAAALRVPALQDVGMRLFFNGPESFTPDDRYLLGEAPELRGCFVAAGFNSVGIQSAGGAGKVLADWIVDGRPPMDLWDVDIRRVFPYQAAPDYLEARTVETLGLLYAMHWPFRQYETARDQRHSPLHEELAARGACFGELAGWERPNWFAPGETAPTYEYSYGRQNWFERSAAEHRGVREAVGLFDQTSFAKTSVEGPDACRELERICANRVDVEPGTAVYTQWLNPAGGIEADLTVTRLAEERYLIVGGAATQVRDLDWLRRNIADDSRVELADVSQSLAVLGVMGPSARALLASLTETDLSNGAFPFRASRQIEVAGLPVRATRITYVGELGWELYVAPPDALALYRALRGAGEGLGVVDAGYHALDSLRMEKAYRHWGHDVTPDDTPLEAGLGFAIAFDKPGGFIGRESLSRQRERGLERRLVVFVLEDPAPLLLHDEPVWRDGVLVGRTTSGAFGHSVGRACGLGYVSWSPHDSAAAIRESHWEIEIANQRHAARASLRPLYDPKSERIRG